MSEASIIENSQKPLEMTEEEMKHTTEMKIDTNSTDSNVLKLDELPDFGYFEEPRRPRRVRSKYKRKRLINLGNNYNNNNYNNNNNNGSSKAKKSINDVIYNFPKIIWIILNLMEIYKQFKNVNLTQKIQFTNKFDKEIFIILIDLANKIFFKLFNFMNSISAAAALINPYGMLSVRLFV